MSGEGMFTGFIGAQKVTSDFFDALWKRFQSAEDREAQEKNLSIPFNNITVDDRGFVYVTVNFTEAEHLSQQLSSIKSKTATYSPVKKLNSVGKEIMKRNGFFDPGGEVDVQDPNDLSKIIDIAIGNEDPVAPAKILKEYAEKIESFEILAGYLDGQVVDKDTVAKLADIPSKEVLIAKLLGSIKSPLYGLAYALQAVVDKDGEAATEAAPAEAAAEAATEA